MRTSVLSVTRHPHSVKIRCRYPALDFTVTESVGHFGQLKKPDELVGRDSQIFDRQLARSKSAESAALCPSDMMLCVISLGYYLVQNGKSHHS